MCDINESCLLRIPSGLDLVLFLTYYLDIWYGEKCKIKKKKKNTIFSEQKKMMYLPTYLNIYLYLLSMENLPLGL